MITLPEHKAELSITHNEHKNVYQTVKEYVSNDVYFDFVSKEDRQKCIDRNELWILQWYPDTPIGFLAVAGSTLDIVLNNANEQK